MTDTTAPLHPLAGETLLSFAQAAKQLPSRSGGRAHATTLWRWSTIGARTPNGRVKLERVRVGSVWFTSREALSRFFAALAEPADDDRPPIRTPTQRKRASERAARQLENLGVS
jgi:hypothetical protein